MLLSVFLCILLAYFIGTLSPAYLIGRLNGADIRELGSKNAGATNVVLNYGFASGLFTAVVDIFKAVAAVHLCIRLFPMLKLAREIAGVAVVFGHIFPWYLHFRGGKGLACLGGVVLSYHAGLFFVMLGLAALIALVTNYVCFVPISISLCYPAIYGALTGLWTGALVYCLLPMVICPKHFQNLKRIRMGTEARFSWLWNKQQEEERLKKNIGPEGNV